IRELNHRTRGPDAFPGPAELYRLVTELVLLVDGLPQLLNQLGRWLHAEPGPTVSRATAHMADAGGAARELAHSLARAQQHLAHLGATRPDRTINHAGQPTAAAGTWTSECRRQPVRAPAR